MLVRQFRPAVFCKSEAAKTVPWNPETIPTNEFSTESGKTWELCAGIIGIVTVKLKILGLLCLYYVSKLDLSVKL